MARVLLIEDDEQLRTLVEHVLRLAGHEVVAASTGAGGIRAVGTFKADVAVVDLVLPDRPGLDVIVAIRALDPTIRCLVVTGFGALSFVVGALRRGASDFLEKPVDHDALLAAVACAASSRRERGPVVAMRSLESHDLARWSEAVVRFVSSPRDATTLASFGRVVGISTGAFRNWCRTACVSSRGSLQFARALRAVTLRQRDAAAAPEKILDIVDLRTWSKFLVASGGTRDRLPSTVDEFLQRQRHVEPEAVVAIRKALTASAQLAASALASPIQGAARVTRL